MPYTDLATVKLIACVNATDLRLTDTDYDNLVNKIITWATGEINTYLGRSYTDAELAADATLAATLGSIATHAVDNYLLSQLQRKQTPIIKINDFVVKNPPRIILTNDMKEALNPYRARPGVSYTAGTERFVNDKTDLIASDD